MVKHAKEKVFIKQLSKDIILLRTTLEYLDGICRLNHSNKNFTTHHDLLASASFQLLQVSRSLKDVSSETLKLLPSIDTDTMTSWSNNLIWNYFQVNQTMLIAYLKDISKDAIKNEIKAACNTISKIRAKRIRSYKRKQKLHAA